MNVKNLSLWEPRGDGIAGGDTMIDLFAGFLLTCRLTVALRIIA